MGSEDSALDWFGEDESLNELDLLRFVEGKKVGFEGEMATKRVEEKPWVGV